MCYFKIGIKDNKKEMNYPLISEYIEAIKSAEDNFEQLKNLRPVLDEDGEPVMTSGNFAVVFKMKNEQTGKLHAVKCFLKEQEGRAEAYRMIAEELEYVSSTFLTPIKYLDKELFVDSKNSDETEFPVLLMDWVEGKTLDKYLRENLDDKFALEMLAFRFSQLAQWLIPLPYAHGDLKPDNILVREDGTLVLVDYDGMYVPAMRGQRARELGSPDFRHPQRTEDDFDEHIDDFPIVSILLSLKAISINPYLLNEYGAADRLLLSENEYLKTNDNYLLNEIFLFMKQLDVLVGLLLIMRSNYEITIPTVSLIHISSPQISTEVPNVSEIVEDGLAYSEDYYYLTGVYGNGNCLFYPGGLYIDNRTKVICDGAFDIYNNFPFLLDAYDHPAVDIGDIEIPSGVIAIGKWVFSNCHDLAYIKLPNSLISIGDGAFYGCPIGHLTIPDGVTNVGRRVFRDCTSLKSVILSNNIKELPQGFFEGCTKLEQVTLPQELKIIGRESFKDCKSLETVTLPQRVKRIDNSVFEGCTSLKDIDIPESIVEIGDGAFSDCKSLQTFSIPKRISKISNYLLSGCTSLEKIEIPEGVKEIGEGAFSGCKSFRTFRIPNGIRKISDHLLSGCSNLSEIDIPESVTEIGEGAFSGCKSFRTFRIPNGIRKISDHLLSGCSNLSEIDIPESVTEIGLGAFLGCNSLQSIKIPISVKSVESWAFKDCINLHEIHLTNCIEKIGFDIFDNCPNLEKIVVPYGAKTHFTRLLKGYENIMKEVTI